jgi:dipeptidyl aminopeptidase/acylaminoacyl peptidase
MIVVTIIRLFLAAVLLSLCAAATLTAAQTAAQPPAGAIPVERFFQLPAYASPSLSPDGKSIALLARIRGRHNLVVYDLETKRPFPVTSFDDNDVLSAHWVNDKRLIFTSGNAFDPSNSSDSRAGGLYAIDRDATNYRRLAQSYSEARRSGAIVYRSVGFANAASDGSDDVYIYSNERSAESYDIYRINTRNGRRTLLTPQSPTRLIRGWIDQNDVPRIVLGVDKLNALAFYRADEQSPWQKIHDADFRQPSAIPVAVDFDGKTVYALSNLGRDTTALVQWDPASRAPIKTLFEHPQADVTDLVFDRVAKKLVGARFTHERTQIHWLDDGWRATQKSIDAALPNAANVFRPPDFGKRFLVTSYSDKNPGALYLFDGETRKLEFLLDFRPEIKPEQMAEVRAVRYVARDGMPIPALLTMPKSSSKNAPMIVLPHGGPWVAADEWRWDNVSQFLASRGYAVLRPNFRGTIGLGLKHWVSSLKQWGGTMQDDVTDGVQWAVKQGIADPKRVCIFGQSYGGYAAMQGVVKTPELYRCAINFAGVTDLLLLQTATWSDANDSEFWKHRAPVLLGDLDADRGLMTAHSPARNAEKIIAPVLMFYGAEDRRVPIEHGERMLDALKRAGKGARVHMEVFSNEEHGISKLENRVKAYTMVEAFLRESLK